MADAQADAGAAGLITLSVRWGDGVNPGSPPVVGDSVVFTDESGSQIATTDANGVASAMVTGSTTVTWVQIFESGSVVRAASVVGAMPGDEIAFVSVGYGATERAPIAVAFDEDPNASYYRACGPCTCAEGPRSPLSLSMHEYCVTPSAVVTLIEYQGTGETVPLGYVTATTPYDPTTGSSITISSPLTAAPVYTSTSTNVGALINRIYFGYYNGPGASHVVLTQPLATTTLQVGGWENAPSNLRWLGTAFQGADGASQTVSDEITASTTGQAIDFATDLLPWLAIPSFDAATGTFTTSAGAGISGDLFIADVSYPRAAGGAVSWTVFAESAGSFTLPVIPTSVVDMTAQPGAGFHAISRIVASDSVNGFAAARRAPYSVALRASTSGRIVVSDASRFQP